MVHLSLTINIHSQKKWVKLWYYVILLLWFFFGGVLHPVASELIPGSEQKDHSGGTWIPYEILGIKSRLAKHNLPAVLSCW